MGVKERVEIGPEFLLIPINFYWFLWSSGLVLADLDPGNSMDTFSSTVDIRWLIKSMNYSFTD
jgi:hypothetical protein